MIECDTLTGVSQSKTQRKPVVPWWCCCFAPRTCTHTTGSKLPHHGQAPAWAPLHGGSCCKAHQNTFIINYVPLQGKNKMSVLWLKVQIKGFSYQSFWETFLLYMWPVMFLYGGQMHLQRTSSKFCNCQENRVKAPPNSANCFVIMAQLSIFP